MSRDLQTEFLTLHEFVAAARTRLDANGWDYLVGGAETETTVARNRLALDRIALRPRVLVDVTEIDTSCGNPRGAATPPGPVGARWWARNL